MVGPPRVYLAPKGARTFPNQLPGSLADEVAEAAAVGAKPIQPGTPAFEAAVNEGTLKFVVNESGELLVSPHTVGGVEISHAVLSGGRPVLSAGQANIAGAGGKFIGLELTPHSGHFFKGLRSESLKALDVAREAFRKFGVEF